MLSIGEFSHTTRLSVKTIRYYQELGILIPAETDAVTGYRYFDQGNYERAQSIVLLKELGFTLKEIGSILRDCREEDDLNSFIEKKINEVDRKLASLKTMREELQVLKNNTAAPASIPDKGISEIDFALPSYAGLELTGAYELIGKAFSGLYKKFGRFARGKPYTFYMDLEHKEGEARMEAVIELKESAAESGVSVKSFKTTRAVRILHQGPYGSQGRSYLELFNYCRDRGYVIKAPIIEHYIKGPGMIFRGNPELYQTECIVLIQEAGES